MSRPVRLYGLLLGLAAANYLAMLLWSVPHLSAMAGGLRPFDLRLAGYTAAEARALLDALGAEGRAFYLNVQLRLDLPFPALFALCCAVGLWRLGAGLARPLRLVLVSVPLLGAGFDYAENARVAAMLRDGRPPDALVAAASRATVAKFVLDGASLALLLAGLVARGTGR